MDTKRNRNKMLADTNESGYVWTGPKSNDEMKFSRLKNNNENVITK